jgi:phage tail sheath protein FI
MATDYKTPGVYVVEKNSFGSSIVANATAIPAFIGFTEYAIQPNGEPLNRIKDSEIVYEPVLVRSMLEYEQSFGGADKTGDIMVTEHPDTGAYTATVQKNGKSYTPGFMFPSMSNFFSNGGGSCYIISLGTYSEFNDKVKAADVTNEMSFIEKAIEQAETTTLILPTDLLRYGGASYYSWGTQLINFSQQEKKYFTVMDVIQEKPTNPVYYESDIAAYRESVNPEFPSYAGAYFPYLKSMTPYAYKDDLSNVYLDGSKLVTGGAGINAYEAVLEDMFTASYKSTDLFPKATSVAAAAEDDPSTIEISEDGNELTITYASDATDKTLQVLWDGMKSNYPEWTLEFKGTPSDGEAVINELGMWKNVEANVFPFIVTGNQAQGVTEATEKMNATIAASGDDKTHAEVAGAEITIKVPADTSPSKAIAIYDPKNPIVQLAVNPAYILPTVTVDETVDLPKITVTNAKIEDVKTFLAINYINMPPSPFMAGIYSRLDNATGVWTPPANTSPIGVTGPVVPLTNKQQENLNVDAVSGKSVNAIRSFTGKGTLVWGARTNDGNSLDWRYINVRRLFISMETDISMALEAYVFKPNVHNTWVEVKTMIESYLLGLYNKGAFAGTTPATSYSVLIGQGVTMTDEDILNGYMRVSIQVAPVRPAEFIVLTFSQMVGQ